MTLGALQALGAMSYSLFFWFIAELQDRKAVWLSGGVRIAVFLWERVGRPRSADASCAASGNRTLDMSATAAAMLICGRRSASSTTSELA